MCIPNHRLLQHTTCGSEYHVATRRTRSCVAVQVDGALERVRADIAAGLTAWHGPFDHEGSLCAQQGADGVGDAEGGLAVTRSLRSKTYICGGECAVTRSLRSKTGARGVGKLEGGLAVPRSLRYSACSCSGREVLPQLRHGGVLLGGPARRRALYLRAPVHRSAWGVDSGYFAWEGTSLGLRHGSRGPPALPAGPACCCARRRSTAPRGRRRKGRRTRAPSHANGPLAQPWRL